MAIRNRGAFLRGRAAKVLGVSAVVALASVLATPSAAMVHKTVCATTDTTTALVVGSIRDAATGQALAGARVSAAW